MKKLFFLFLVLIMSAPTQAQFGLNAGYVSNDKLNWQGYFPGNTFLDSGWKVGLDYWFRLKNYRIEFTPELSLERFGSKVESNLESGQFNSNLLGLKFHTNIYLFNLKGDCDCPTFSKDGDVFKKGLFLRISPGVTYFQQKADVSDQNFDSNHVVPSVGVGVGLDLGVNDFFTVTPIVSFDRYFGAEWTDLSTISAPFENVPLESANEVSDFNQLYIGVRLGFRFDELNKYGYR